MDHEAASFIASGPNRSPRRRRPRRGVLAVALVAVALLSACGDDSTAEGSTGAASDGDSQGAGSPAGAYPVTLDTAFGPVTIEKKPERIVAVGVEYAAADVAVALDVLPVGLPESFSDDSGIVPWLQDDYQGKEVELLDFADGVPFEKIAALKPDLILAGTYWALEDDYAGLAAIAPTLTYSAPTYAAETWQNQARLVGKALGEEGRAEELVDEVEAAVEETATSHPQWAGKSLTFSVADVDLLITAFDPEETDVKMLEALGLQLAPGVLGLDASELSFEQIGLLEGDLTLVCYRSPEAKAALEGNPVFQGLESVKAGRYIEMPITVSGWMRVPSVLSVPEILTELEKLLPAA